MLIISDDHDTRSKLLKRFLRSGFVVSTTTRSKPASSLVNPSADFDLLLLDLAGAACNGHVLGEVQAALPDATTLVLIEQADLERDTSPIQWDADDFIVRPFSVSELCVRIETVLQRNELYTASRRQCTVQDITLDLSTRTCYRDGTCVALTAREFDLLDYLFRHRGCAVSRETLAENVWGAQEAIALRTIDRHVTAIRQKIEDDPSSPVYLQTVYGEGYRFMPGC